MNPYLPVNNQDTDSIVENYDDVVLGKPTTYICPMCGAYMNQAEALDGWDNTVDILECDVCGYQDLSKE